LTKFPESALFIFCVKIIADTLGCVEVSKYAGGVGRPNMAVILDMIARGWDNFLDRPSGAMNFRFLVQPTMAGLLALRAGVEDAREGRRGYIWALLTNRQRRLQLLAEGWGGARAPFLISIGLDAVYQLRTFKFIYPLEALFTAALLALVPYVLLRGPFNAIARLILRAARSRNAGKDPDSLSATSEASRKSQDEVE
jgi:hypothetical protein